MRLREFAETLAPVRIGDDWGYIDSKGKIAIKPQFFQTSGFEEPHWLLRCLASLLKKVIDGTVEFYNYIDKNGQINSKNRYSCLPGLSEGVAQVLTRDNKHGVIDKQGPDSILPLIYIQYRIHSIGLAMFKLMLIMPDTKSGMSPRLVSSFCPRPYSDGEDFSEGLACTFTAKGRSYSQCSRVKSCYRL